MRAEHDELEIFLETRLISSRVDQKLKNKRGKYMLLKKEIRPTIVGDGVGRERRLRRRGSGSLVRRLSSRFLCNFRLNFGFKMHHDQATIAPRSGHDRSPGHASHTLRSSGKNSTLKEQRSRFDRAAIVEFFHRPSTPSDSIFRWLEGHDRLIAWTLITRVVRRPIQSSGGWRVTIAWSREPWLRESSAVRFNLQVAGGSRSLDRVNPDYESRPPSDSIFRWLEGHDRLIAWTPITRVVRRPMEEDRAADRDRYAVRPIRIRRFSVVHVAPGKPSI